MDRLQLIAYSTSMGDWARRVIDNKVLTQNYQNLQVLTMIRRPARKGDQSFPFSAYILKSYSTENSRQLMLDNRSESNSIKQLNQYLNILEINARNKKDINSINQSNEFRHTDTALKKDNESRKQKKVVCDVMPTLRPEKQSRIKIKSLSPVKKARPVENKKIVASLRYQIVSLYSLLGRREDYMSWLKGRAESPTIPLKNSEIDDIMHKYEQTKGRDKGRTKFNYITNEQLRSLKYKPKVTVVYNNSPKKQQKEKVHYDEDEEIEEQEAEEKEEIVDFATWKRRNGIGYNQRVFIIKGGYAELRKSLLERGWAENQDVWSPYYDFKWTTRICDINFMGLKHSQGVNHFNNNHHLTSKYGITRRLKTLQLSSGVDSDKFYPRCFDLGDQVDFQNFVQNFKNTFAESVAKRFLVDKQRYKGLELKIRITYEIMKRRSQSFASLVININKGVFPAISAQEWSIITQTAEIDEQQKKKKLNDLRKMQKAEFPLQNPEQQSFQALLYEKIDQRMRKNIEILKEKDPQFDINGMRNVWIAKPNFMSRGRGIRCFNNIYDIADYCLGQPTQFVVQKYIQNPLLIEGRKFDIRQWVMIQDFNPPKVWFYEQCYLRFSNDQYSLDNIYNRFVHLTNNSIQKYSKKHNAEKSMWDMHEFSEWLGQQKWKAIQEKMKNIVVWSIKSCEGQVIGKKGSMQLVGYDFMIDQNLNPWLIEINMSPAMDYSTPVTKKLVKLLLQDTGKLMSTNKKSKSVGGYSLIYKGQEDLATYDAYNI